MALPADAVEQLSDHLDIFHYIEPVNSDEEREAFHAAVEEGRRYNPSYKYRECSAADGARKLLEEVATAAEGTLERSLVAAFRGKLRMIEAVGSPDITERSQAYYGSPDTELVNAAQEQFAPPGAAGEKAVGSTHMREAFEALFDEIGVSYGCEVADVDIVRNAPRAEGILLPRGKTYTVADAKRLLVHESTHSVRAVNGMEAGSAPLIHGTNGYEVAEEGLATVNEEAVGAFRTTLPRITARVIAVAAAGTGFYALYQEMRELGLDPRSAFVRAYRVKRGLQDTSRPGGFIKDHIYFQGYTRLASTPELADRLYAGKVGFDDIDAVTSSPAVTRNEHLAACETVVGELFE